VNDGEHSKGRTIVLSDAHGFPELVSNALAHCAFSPASDALVFAGDFIDRGPDPGGVLDALTEAGAVMLLGNHDVALMMGGAMWLSDPESAPFRTPLLEGALPDEGVPRWRIAWVVDGVLITHAGVSAAYQRVFDVECGHDVSRLAARLNEDFVEASIEVLATDGDPREHLVLGDEGPLWWRYVAGGTAPLKGCRQVFGHTPVEMLTRSDSSLRRMDLYGIDPYVYAFDADNRPPAGRCKYAVIEGGEVTVVDVSGNDTDGR